MVSLWPFGGKGDSPDAFERKLSQLATQIQEHDKKLNNLRGRGKRFKALWTLYTVLSWVVYTIILVLVVGLDSAQPIHIGGFVGGPIVIYLVRKLILLYYDWRTNKIQTSLHSLQSQQRENIEKLKAATKFNSTAALLERYSGSAGIPAVRPSSPKRGLSAKNTPKKTSQNQVQTPPSQQAQNRARQTPIQLPRVAPAQPIPTPPQIQHQAPIPVPVPAPAPIPQPVPHRMTNVPSGPPPLPPSSRLRALPEDEPKSPKWYDRFMDVLLGEDETSPKTRYALICSNCRQVNGLAPPGTHDINDIRYRCGRCGADNGKPEVGELMQQIVEDQSKARHEENEAVERSETPSRKVKGSARKKGKKKPAPPPVSSSSSSVDSDSELEEQDKDDEKDIKGEKETEAMELDDSGESEEVVSVVRKRRSARNIKR